MHMYFDDFVDRMLCMQACQTWLSTQSSSCAGCVIIQVALESAKQCYRMQDWQLDLLLVTGICTVLCMLKAVGGQQHSNLHALTGRCLLSVGDTSKDLLMLTEAEQSFL